MILNNIRVAKQAIVDDAMRNIGEEVLYRGSAPMLPPWDLRLMLNASLIIGEETMHVNVMPSTFPFLNEVESMLPISRYKGRMVFEIVEAGIKPHLSDIRAFGEKGYRLAMDDFGSAEANYGVLEHLPPRLMPIIKMDMNFLQKWDVSHVSSTIAALQKRGYKVYLEGCEKTDHVIAGADGYQGFLFQKPVERDYLMDVSNITVCLACGRERKKCA